MKFTCRSAWQVVEVVPLPDHCGRRNLAGARAIDFGSMSVISGGDALRKGEQQGDDALVFACRD